MHTSCCFILLIAKLLNVNAKKSPHNCRHHKKAGNIVKKYFRLAAMYAPLCNRILFADTLFSAAHHTVPVGRLIWHGNCQLLHYFCCSPGADLSPKWINIYLECVQLDAWSTMLTQTSTRMETYFISGDFCICITIYNCSVPGAVLESVLCVALGATFRNAFDSMIIIRLPESLMSCNQQTCTHEMCAAGVGGRKLQRNPIQFPNTRRCNQCAGARCHYPLHRLLFCRAHDIAVHAIRCAAAVTETKTFLR